MVHVGESWEEIVRRSFVTKVETSKKFWCQTRSGGEEMLAQGKDTLIALHYVSQPFVLFVR